MIPEKAFERLLGLDEGGAVAAAEYETEPSEQFVLVVRETEQLWPQLVCPVPTCGCHQIVCHDHAEARAWRHLDAFGKRTEIHCAPARARCTACRQVWRVPVPWEGEGKHFTRDFEAFALTLMREMPMKKAGEILGEHDTRLWRMLFAHVDKAYAALDLSELVHLGVDEMNRRKGHNYLTVFADLVKNRVVFATEGKDHTTFQRFTEEILKHNGHPKAITAVAMDLSQAYQKGAREELGNAQMVFDPFHVSALVSEAVDAVRRREAAAGPAAKAALKKTLYLFRKNPENLTEQQQARMDELEASGHRPGLSDAVGVAGHLPTDHQTGEGPLPVGALGRLGARQVRAVRRVPGTHAEGGHYRRQASGRHPGPLDQQLVKHSLPGRTQ